jgi:hypothetical protein
MIWHERPTLGELRAKVHKERHREIGNWLARLVGRPLAVYGTWLAIRLGLSAHQVTVAAVLASIGSAVAIGLGTRLGFIVGVGLAQLAFWLDHVDGQVARWRRSASLDGVYFDYLMHHLVALTQGFALGFGLAVLTGNPYWSVAGFCIGLGWLFQSIHNDCRYKSFFQRLKRESGAFRVEGGAGGKPAPPSSWPRRGLGMLTWPGYKACEAHTVLAGLTVLALCAMFWPETWLILWKWNVAIMAMMAPALALARSTRAITRGTAEAEFRAWFQPIASTDLDLNPSEEVQNSGDPPSNSLNNPLN